MASAGTMFFRASRPAFQQQMFAGGPARAAFRQGPNSFFRRQGPNSKRWQSSTGAGAESEGQQQQQQQSWFKRMWDSPVGIKTVHFWAPIMKWSIVLAGIGDFFRPAEKLSVTQNAALTATGIIWTRWCFIIKPRNILLAAVNFFMGCVGIIQLTRIAMLDASKKPDVASAIEDVKKDVKENAPTPIKENAS